jgi:hypothetical protein
MFVLFSSGLDIFVIWVLVEVLMEAIDAPVWVKGGGMSVPTPSVRLSPMTHDAVWPKMELEPNRHGID